MIHRPGHTMAAVKATLLNASVSGPRLGDRHGDMLFPSTTSSGFLLPSGPCLICQVQNGSLVRNWRAGRAPQPVVKEITLCGHRPEPRKVKGGRYFRPERKYLFQDISAHEMNYQGQIILRKTLRMKL